MKLGFIGFGNMATAIISGLSLKAFTEVFVYDPAKGIKDKAKKFNVKLLESNSEVIERSDIVVFAIKPQYFSGVISELSDLDFNGKLIISIMAGVKSESFSILKGAKIVRTMPNTPALIRRGITAILKNEQLNNKEKGVVESIFAGIGKFVWIDKEEQIDSVTALSGSGPAYFFSFIEGLIMAGIKVGLSYDLAYELAVETGIGSLVMMRETKENPAELRNKVSSPAGTTIYALSSLERAGFKGEIVDAVYEAYLRSIELGKKD